MTKLLLTGCFNYTGNQLELLHALGYDIYFMQQEKEILPFPASEIEAIVCNGLFLYHDIDDFTSLRIIQLTSAGLERVPIDKIRERRIELHNARGVYNIPMAEWVMFRVLEHYKKGWFFKKEQESIRWTKHRGIRELNGTKIAIIGAGNIGQEVAKRFHAFGVETTGYDIHVSDTMYFDHMRFVSSLENEIRLYDIVIVTALLLPSTVHLMSRSIIKGMKENSILVNISRGALIDEDSLCEILTERKDMYAALDVFEKEPLPENSPLWKLDNVAVSPHNSFVSNRTRERMFDVIYNNLKNYINR